jgi:hypothetical protein
MMELTIFPFQINKVLADDQMIDKPESKIMRTYRGWWVKTPESFISRIKPLITKDKIINFYVMIPLTSPELEFYMKNGTKKFLRLFNKNTAGWVISQSRKSVL